MAEEPNPIEIDNGNVAPVVENQAAAAQEEEGNERAGPSPEDVYNCIVLFEGTLKDAWDEFKDSMMSEVAKINDTISSLEDDVRKLERTERRKIDFAVGMSVVLLDKRKIGIVESVTKLYVDVLLDGEQNRNKMVQKKKSLLERFYN